MAAQDGWKVLYLSPNLPSAEIAHIALQNQAHVIALSIVYPSDDPILEKDLQNLGQYLTEDIKILVGGNSAGAYKNVLEEIGAILVTDLREFRSLLASFRTL